MTEVKSMWGDGIRAGLAVTVDVDADTFWFGRFERNAVPPCAQSEALYGIQAGLPRLLRMFDRLACRGTFFVPGWIAERYPQEIGAIVAEKHEIAYHGYLHEKTAGAQDEQSLIVRCKEIFLDQWGIRPVGYRYPEFGLRPDLIDILIDEGFLYSSNLMDRDQPYLLQGSGDRHLVELPTSWLFDDSSHFFFTIYPPPRRPIAPPSHVREIWETEFEGISREGGSMVLVLHPSISGRTSRVRMLEELLLSIKDHPGNLIAPASELAERARMALREMVDRDTGL